MITYQVKVSWYSQQEIKPDWGWRNHSKTQAMTTSTENNETYLYCYQKPNTVAIARFNTVVVARIKLLLQASKGTKN